MNIRNYYSVYS